MATAYNEVVILEERVMDGRKHQFFLQPGSRQIKWTTGVVAFVPIRPKQLRRLHALWRRWAGRAGLSKEADRRLRHYFVWLITESQCTETTALSSEQAARVIQWLARRVRLTETPQNYIAGTAGRLGFPEQRRTPPSEAAWHALWGCAAALGMSREGLEQFIHRHYSGVGLKDLADLRTMADLNRVLWGLKAMLRRQIGSK